MVFAAYRSTNDSRKQWIHRQRLIVSANVIVFKGNHVRKIIVHRLTMKAAENILMFS
ncbi:hypothetical protein RRSWK_06932 [Rhodopirellula sp. SWK7]|nr:hypothetical protein RRSWK_06932 [Rhodopirellula sp. SWK7]